MNNQMSTIDLFVRLLLVNNTLDNDLLNVSHKDSYKAMHTGDVHLCASMSNFLQGMLT